MTASGSAADDFLKADFAWWLGGLFGNIVLATLLFGNTDAYALGTVSYIETTPQADGFTLVQHGTSARICIDADDFPGVLRAADNLAADITRVAGVGAKVDRLTNLPSDSCVIIGTIGKSRFVDELIRSGKLDPGGIAGKWESFLIHVLPDPFAGVSNAVVIAGSDKRGTIFGIYDLCEQIGVSPWYWWADVPPRRADALYVKPGRRVEGPPAVQYRGIFLNDEAPALTGWVKKNFGTYHHRFYTNVFELILRLKGNYLWPAMWDNSFATDDPLTPKLADEFGIVVSTSHHEPMMRAWKEWERAGNRKGSWDYSKNAEKLREFWKEGLRRTKDYEKVITLGMRGDGDEPMSETESVALLERIVADQRQMISEVINPKLTAVPQVWALYKEVQGYYERGMRVPDDVMLLWCDDNWGDLRRLPTPEERKRTGGAGIYYHLDYVGGPRNYKWLNTVPITKIQQQMELAWRYGADRVWIVNVGDLKPVEFPMEFFLRFAWDPGRWPKDRLGEYTRLWANREFGAEHADAIADIISKYTKYNGRRKPELLEAGTFSLLNYAEAETVSADWQAITTKAESVYETLPESARAAFYELVLHPTKACAVVNELYIAAAKNRLYAAQGRAGANDLAWRVKELFKQDAALSDYFNHQLLHGKWDHMMDQTHIGYTYWQQPPSNAMPKVIELEIPESGGLGVAIEGSSDAWPGATNEPVLPPLDNFNRSSRYIEVFNRGRSPFEFRVATDVPWLEVRPTAGQLDKQQRLVATVRWDQAPKGSATGVITVSGSGSAPIKINVPIFNPAEPERESLNGFVESDGCVSIESEHYTRQKLPESATASADSPHWEKIPDLGRTLSSMTIFPVTCSSVIPPQNSPCLEYQVYLFTTGAVEILSIVGPCLNFDPGRSVRMGISIDAEPPQILTVVPKNYVAGDGNRDWEESVKDSVRKVKSTHQISRAGYHTLKVWMVDPGVVLQKLVLNTGGVRPSYLGPPESYHHSPSLHTP